MSDTWIENQLKSPENRAKLQVILLIVQISAVLSIAAGVFFLILLFMVKG